VTKKETKLQNMPAIENINASNKTVYLTLSDKFGSLLGFSFLTIKYTQYVHEESYQKIVI